MAKRNLIRHGCNGHYLEGRHGKGGWHWRSDFPDIAAAHQGDGESGPAVAEFMRRCVIGGVCRRMTRKET